MVAMRRVIALLLGAVLLSAIMTPAAGAQERPPQPLPVDQAPFAEVCDDLGDFRVGCVTSGGPWSSVFADFASETGVPANSFVGARVQFFPSEFAADPFNELIYIVGPYLPATSEGDDFDRLTGTGGELEKVRTLAPVLPAIEDALRDQHASVVYIGFGDYEDSQQPTAQRVLATKRAIQSFELVRRANSSGEHGATALLGISLGGVAGKIALRELEAEGFDHGVDTFVSFDSPHGGTYVPVALQQIPIFLSGAFDRASDHIDSPLVVLCPGCGQPLQDASDGAALAATTTLGSPLGQELLIVNVAFPEDRSPNFGYIINRFRDLPRQTERNVAIASGSIDGTPQTVGPTFLAFDTGKSRNKFEMELVIGSNRPTLENPATLYGRLKWRKSAFSTHRYRRRHSAAPGLISNFERAPCSYSTTIVDGVVENLNAELTVLWKDFEISAIDNEACFVPSYSAVGGNYNPTTGPVAGTTAFDQVIGDSENKEHLFTSDPMDDEILALFNNIFAEGPSGSPDEATPEEDDATDGPEPGGMPVDEIAVSEGGSFTDSSASEGGPTEPAPLEQVETATLQSPGNFALTVYSSTAIGIDWQKVDGATRYVLKRDGAVLYDSNGNGFWDAGLAPGTTHTYTLVAMDGDKSSTTLAATATTRE